MSIPKKIITAFVLLFSLFLATPASAQTIPNGHPFNMESASDPTKAGFGELNFTATNDMVITYIMAYGENVKSLNLQINGGFVYKLAPAAIGLSLNYVGNGMDIAVKKGDKIILSFTDNTKGSLVKHIFISGKKMD